MTEKYILRKSFLMRKKHFIKDNQKMRQESIGLILLSILLFSFFLIETNYIINIQSDSVEPLDTISLGNRTEIMQPIMPRKRFELTGIDIMFGTYARENEGDISVSLLENDTVVSEWTTSASSLKDNSYAHFYLSKGFRASKNASYSLKISEEYDGDNNVAIYVNNNTGIGYSVGNNVTEIGSICYLLNYDSLPIRILLIITGLLIGSLVITMLLLDKNEVKIMSGILGAMLIAYMIVCPLGIAPDEEGHFLRAFEIANGNLISIHIGEDGHGGNILPVALCSYDDPSATIDWNDVEEIGFGNLSLYAPVSYIPQSIGIAITQTFTDNVALIFYGGKCAHALFCFFLCLFALRLVPFGRRVLFIILMMPMTLHEMISLSPDGFTISLCILFLSYVLHLSYLAENITYKDMIVLSVLGIIISLCKIVYVVLLILIFMLPEKKFPERIKGVRFKVGLFLIAGILNFIWLRISASYLVEFRPGVNSVEQVKFILTHMGSYYAVSVRTLIENIIFYLSTMVGTSLGALNVPITPAIWVIVVVLLVYETLTLHDNEKPIHKYDPIILLSVFLCGSALIFTSIYVQWTAVGSQFIEGIQGRYFTPIIAMLAFSIMLFRQKLLTSAGVNYVLRNKASYSILIMLLVNGLALLNFIKNYYC